MGVQQGDPIGPLLFALALQPIILQLSTIQGLELAFSFLDDLVLAGEDSAVAQGINMLQILASPIGLRLNQKKCELIPAAEGENGIDWRMFDSSIPKNQEGGFRLLGAPIGKTEYCQFLTAERVVRIQSSLDAIGALPDLQVALALLRSCASYGKMVLVVEV